VIICIFRRRAHIDDFIEAGALKDVGGDGGFHGLVKYLRQLNGLNFPMVLTNILKLLVYLQNK
jgi:hypothetical protein